jgi:hypothetical protein
MKVMITGAAGATRKSMFEYLKANKAEIIRMKTAEHKRAEAVYYVMPVDAPKAAAKAYLYENNEERGILKRTIVANTYLWLDSHDDVHIPGIFTKSIAERGARAPHMHDHQFTLEAKVGNVMGYTEREIDWKELGVDLAGKTTSLLLESEILEDYNKKIYKMYLKGQIDQHSVSMRYVRVDLAVDDEDYPEEYKVWKSLIDKIGNREKAVEQGYFFAIREAQLIETSAVIAGSNELTPTLGVTQVPDNQKSTPEVPPLIALDVEGILKSYTSTLKA